MHEKHAALIKNFYDSFARGDAEGMVACYHTNIIFSDPAFGRLEGAKACNMWRMLLSGNKVDVTYALVSADEHKGSATWQAIYFFGPDKRKVVNRISASFVFWNGLIIEHADSFDLWKWARQAMGLKGWLLGKTRFFQHKLRRTVLERLRAFEAKQTG